jgi:peptidoglycan hydrolase CwlO-like protein
MANVIAKTQSIISHEVKPITEAKDKLEGLTEEEKYVLEKLFTLTQEIEEMEKEEERINKEIESLQLDVKKMELGIVEQEKEYEDKLYILEKILVGYQRRGPASYIDTLLGAGDIKTLVRSINIIREFAQNTNKLLEEVEVKKKQLVNDKEQLEKSLVAFEEKKEELKKPLKKKLELKKEQENYLETLEEQQTYYSNQLQELEQTWGDIKVLFAELISEFTRIIGEGT